MARRSYRRILIIAIVSALAYLAISLAVSIRSRLPGGANYVPPPYHPSTPRPKPPPPPADPIVDNFPLAVGARRPGDLPSIPRWSKVEQHVTENTPLFIGFTRNWLMLQQAVVSYITAGWPPDRIFVVDNTGTFQSNRRAQLTLQNPFYFDYERLTKGFGVNVIFTPTLLSFAQLQNYFLSYAMEHAWRHYFWSHQDVLVLPDERQKPFTSFYYRAVEVLRETSSPSYGKWATRFFGYDRLTLVNVDAYADVGAFDTLIPFYGTDCDMYERLAMKDYTLEDAFVGHIYDVGSTLPDLRMLYREDSKENTNMCPEDIPLDGRKYGLQDCRYEALVDAADKLQHRKNTANGGRNFWQTLQKGGQGEPYYRDPLGFEQGIHMSTECGKDVMGEKWGHQGCNIRAALLKFDDQWRMQHDKDWEKPENRPFHGCGPRPRHMAPVQW